MHDAQEVEVATGCMTYTLCEIDTKIDVDKTLMALLDAVDHLSGTASRMSGNIMDKTISLNSWNDMKAQEESRERDKKEAIKKASEERWRYIKTVGAILLLVVFVVAFLAAGSFYFPKEMGLLAERTKRMATYLFYVVAGEFNRFSRACARAWQAFKQDGDRSSFVSSSTRNADQAGAGRAEDAMPLMEAGSPSLSNKGI